MSSAAASGLLVNSQQFSDQCADSSMDRRTTMQSCYSEDDDMVL